MIDKDLEDPRAEKTETIHMWIKRLPDDKKAKFAINWRMPHTLFNIACGIYPGGQDALQDVDWNKIYKSRDLGVWGHGGAVYPY